MTFAAAVEGTPAQRWLARLSFVLAGLVGVDGEAVTMPAPVTCTIWPGALRVWVPRDRSGIPAPKPPVNWARLRQLASGRREPAEVTR